MMGVVTVKRKTEAKLVPDAILRVESEMKAWQERLRELRADRERARAGLTEVRGRRDHRPRAGRS